MERGREGEGGTDTHVEREAHKHMERERGSQTHGERGVQSSHYNNY